MVNADPCKAKALSLRRHGAKNLTFFFLYTCISIITKIVDFKPQLVVNYQKDKTAGYASTKTFLAQLYPIFDVEFPLKRHGYCLPFE